jgi:hypothetical protein
MNIDPEIQRLSKINYLAKIGSVMNYIVHDFVCIVSRYHYNQLMVELNYFTPAKNKEKKLYSNYPPFRKSPRS